MWTEGPRTAGQCESIDNQLGLWDDLTLFEVFASKVSTERSSVSTHQIVAIVEPEHQVHPPGRSIGFINIARPPVKD